MRILVIPDKFKGTLTASAAAEAIARGWRKARPQDSLELLPMSDGGDGFGEVMGRLLHGKTQMVETVNAAHQGCWAHWWWEPKTKTAVIESASVIGLAKLPPAQYHPFELDTFGLGAMVRAASNKGAKRCIIGIGGSATNDGGFGLARALGWKFWARDDASIEQWTELHRLARVSSPKRTRWFRELIVAVDVQNPLLGVRGATRVYGPQKGLRRQDLAIAEKCLRTLAAVSCCGGLRPPPLNRRRSSRFGGMFAVPGAGAAGGLGFGLMAFLGAEAEPGFALFARLANLDKHLRAGDLVITAEGRIDESTFMGKGVGEIARWCGKRKTPYIIFAGNVPGLSPDHQAVSKTHSLVELTTVKAAKSNSALWLERLASRTARDWSAS